MSAKSVRTPAGKTARSAVEQDSIGDHVIALRSEGKSFASIAETVGVTRSLEAFALFIDALSRRTPTEQKKLRAEENTRLDVLERRTRRRSDGTDRDRRLASIAKLRQRLAAT